jgi:hypothetical protein
MIKAEIKLYTTLGCHLCEQAEAMFLYLKQQQPDLEGFELVKVEIADDDRLVELYGIRIPVLGYAEKELAWPFELEDLQGFLLSK